MSVTDKNDISLGVSTVTVDLNVTAVSGHITNSGDLNINDTSLFTAANGSDIILNSSGNEFGGAVSFAAVSGQLENITITDTTSLELSSLDITGDLTVTSGVDITDFDIIKVTGSTILSADSDITLDNANDLNDIIITKAVNVTLHYKDDIILGNSTISEGLNITTFDQDISDLGSIKVGGLTNMNAGLGSINLDDAGNTFASVILEANTISIVRATIENGISGGLKIAGTISAEINSCIINGNAGAVHGGGIYIVNGDVEITNSTISDNGTTGRGGGIYVESGNTTVNYSTISGNGATNSHGGGIHIHSGTLNVNNSTISNSTAASRGGGNLC